MFNRQPRYSMDEFKRRGTDLYENKIRQVVEPGNLGRILCIDIESGEFNRGRCAGRRTDANQQES